METQARDRLILALDNVPDDDNAVLETFVDSAIPDALRIVKIGWPWFLRFDIPSAVRTLKRRGKDVFLDAKFADVESVARKLVSRCEHLEVDFVTINHGWPTVEAAVRAKSRGSSLKIFTVTVLTSEDATTDMVVDRAMKARDIGCDGVIASGREAAAIRARAGKDFLIVTPGVRPAGSAADDQRRTVTPREAVLAGANYLVVGRPITGASNPRQAALDILDEMQRALDAR